MKSKIKPQFSRKDFRKTTEQIITPQKIVDHQLTTSFINQLIEGKETVLDTSSASFTVQDILKQKLESHQLPPIDLLHFSGNPVEWLEFSENFFSRVHQKSSFYNNLHMLRLISVLDKETKWVIAAIGLVGIFYATALKTLKKNFGHPLIVEHLKI